MRKIIGVLVLASVLCVPVLADGPGAGDGICKPGMSCGRIEVPVRVTLSLIIDSIVSAFPVR